MQQINIKCNFSIFQDNISEHVTKVTAISDQYKYSNIWINWPCNIIRICICAISQAQIKSDICYMKWY